LVAGIGAYFYSTTADRLYVHLYNQNRARFTLGGQAVEIEQQTLYPWDGDVHLTVTTEQPTEFELALRIPTWCRDYRLEVNGAAVSAAPERGYVVIRREWKTGDTLKLVLSMPVERMLAHPGIRQDAGCIALQRGPVVYCLEEVDNGARLANVTLPHDAKLSAEFDASLFGGVSVITGEAERAEPANWTTGLYQPESTVEIGRTPFTFKAIPYCFWANREPGEMRVWIRER
jgi:DUF1680 family protein